MGTSEPIKGGLNISPKIVTKLDLAGDICSPSTQEAEAGESRASDQVGSYTVCSRLEGYTVT